METSLKVRTLNVIRNVFRIPFMESWLANATAGKSPDHLISKLVPNPYQYPPGQFKTLRRNGLAMKVDISDYIGHYLFFGFTDDSAEKLFSLCNADSVVLDIGANIGWTVLNLARIANKGRVIGFEPDPYNFERCSENLALNKLTNARVFPVGLGNKNDRVNMEVRTPSNRGGNRIAPSGGGSSKPIEIVRLDEFNTVADLQKIDLIKMDVEGYELKVLRGGEATLRKHKPRLFIELDDNNLKDQGDSAAELIQFLNAIGYQSVTNAENGTIITASTDFTGCHFDIVAR